MEISALLTSAGINIGLCVLFFSLYSILRNQPGNANVYFARRISQEKIRRPGTCSFGRLVPSAGWILEAWEYSEDELLSTAGLDAVVFLRILVLSIRIFFIVSLVCIFGVLPLNYYGQEMHHRLNPSESLDVFTIANVKEGSHWLWVHCLALYVISLSACILLYFEYMNVSRMRRAHITESLPNPSHFSVLVRAIPESTDEPLTDTIQNFFTNYHGASYLSHQMIYRSGNIHRIMRRFITSLYA